MRSSLVERRTTSISKRSDWIQSLLRKARMRQYLSRSVSAARGGARSGRVVKRRGRVVSVTWRAVIAEISAKSSKITSLRITVCQVNESVHKWQNKNLTYPTSSSSIPSFRRISLTLCTMNPNSSSDRRPFVVTIFFRPSKTCLHVPAFFSPTVNTPKTSSL